MSTSQPTVYYIIIFPTKDHIYLISPLITGRICRRQLCQYCFYPRPGFVVFRPAGATLCTDQGKIWQGGVHSSFTLISSAVGVYGPQNWNNIIAPKSAPTGGDPIGILWICLMLVKIEWLGYRTVKKLWRCVKPFSYNTSMSRTDRWTELLYQYRHTIKRLPIKLSVLGMDKRNFKEIVSGQFQDNS